jgi:pyridoxine/pyridoxamine 5'-phosphate oxidase
MQEKYHLRLPPYPGTAQCVKLSSTGTNGAAGVNPAAIRLNYDLAEQSGGLTEADAADDPFEQFAAWFEEAVAAKIAAEPNQMALATADAAGVPSVRMVLLKGYDARGFVFYTNHDSRKGREMAANANAALCMYWEPLQRQVCVFNCVSAERHAILRKAGCHSRGCSLLCEGSCQCSWR